MQEFKLVGCWWVGVWDGVNKNYLFILNKNYLKVCKYFSSGTSISIYCLFKNCTF